MKRRVNLVILRALTFFCIFSSTLFSCSRSNYFHTTLAGRAYPADYDRNRDGITDIQAIKAGLDPADPNLASEDPDGDGLTNFWELKLGFDPKVADSDNSIYGGHRGGNGISDCQEDLVGDGIPICWKIRHGIDPTQGNRSLTDSDGDGYSDLEEYLANTDPNGANSRPGGGVVDANGVLSLVLTLKGTTNKYTDLTRVTGTMSYCASNEQVLFTSSKTKPDVNDKGFVGCSTVRDTLDGRLDATTTGTYKMYVWRKIAAGVVETPLSASILYTPRATSGRLSVNPYSNRTLSIALAAPSGTQFKTVRLFRYSELNCSNRAVDDATGVEINAKIGDSLILASGLSYATPYCIKAFWEDDVGNVVTRASSYPGVGPIDGALTISGYDAKTIHLAHTLPTDGNYRTFNISRFETTCAAIATGTGTSVAMDKTATSFSDANLTLATPYCYQVTWADAFGNGKTTTAGYAGTGPGVGTIEITALEYLTIKLKQTPVASPVNPISTTELTRYEDLTCTSTTPTPVVVGANPTGSYTYANSDLSLNKNYCYKMAWFDAFGNSSTATTVYAGGPSGGAISISGLSALAVQLTYTAPQSFSSASLRRYVDTVACASAADNNSAGTSVTIPNGVTTITDSSLVTTKAYCYKAFWYDAFGNVASAYTNPAYSGGGPSGGSIAIDKTFSRSIRLALVAPTSSYYSSMKIRSTNALACDGITASDGTDVPVGQKNATSVATTSVVPATNYCFKAFWYDDFGNVTMTSAASGGSAATTTPSDSCCIISTRTTWYADQGYGGATARYQFVSSPSGTPLSGLETITSIDDPASPHTSWPSIFTTKSGVGSGTATVTGVTTNALALTTWSALLNNAQDIPATTRVINSVPSYTPPSAITLSDNVVSASTPSATLDSQYDGTSTDVSLTLLMANGSGSTTSEGLVGLTQSDIPGLNYTTSSTPTSPYISPGTSNYSSVSKIATGQVNVLWDYTKFDQGDYDIKTLAYLNIDGAKIYTGSNKTKVTVANLGLEDSIIANQSIINQSLYSSNSSWSKYQPALCMLLNTSNNTKMFYAVAYPAFYNLSSTQNHYLDKITIDRSAGSNGLLTAAFNASGSNSNLIPATSSSSESIAMAADSGPSDELLILGGIGVGSDRVLHLAKAGGTNLDVINRVSLSNSVSLIDAATSSAFSNVALTPAFTDVDAKPRHGVAYSAIYSVTNAGVTTDQKGVFITKIRSVPDTETTSGYLDSPLYKDSPSIISAALPESVGIPGSAGLDASLVRITIGNESGTHFFYVGWRDTTAAQVNFARMDADGNSSPDSSIIENDKTADQSIVGMSNLKAGSPAYSIAVGKDNGATPSVILGVLYTTGSCQFRAYKADSTSNPTKLIRIGSTDLSVGSSNDCRFPQLFWNDSSNKFMAVWVEGGASQSGATNYTEFAFDSSQAQPSLVPATPILTTVTAARSGNAKVCTFTANYSPGSATNLPRIGMASVEGTICGSNTSASMYFDLYKPSR